MVKKAIYISLLILLSENLLCQVRHVKGIEMLGAGAGIIADGNSFNISYQRFLNRTFSIKASTHYETVFVEDFRYGLYGLNTACLATILSNKKSLFLNAELGLMMGYDRLRSELIDLEKKKFIIGQSLGLSAEAYLTSNIKIDLSVAQRFFELNQNEQYGVIINVSVFFKI